MPSVMLKLPGIHPFSVVFAITYRKKNAPLAFDRGTHTHCYRSGGLFWYCPDVMAIRSAIWRGGRPVMAAEVRRADVPIFLAGLGTVQAFNSVLVKSRVDGQIVKINFAEGKDVQAGEVLLEID